MTINKFDLTDYKKIKKGFRVDVLYPVIKVCDDGFKRMKSFTITVRCNDLLDLINYIYNLQGHIWIKIANSNNRKTLFGGFVSYFKDQTINYGGLTK